MTKLTLEQPALDLLSYWREAKGDATLPSARFIDPLKLRAWIGDISVVHLHEGARKYYVALHGANVVRHLGSGFHRKYLEDVTPSETWSTTVAPYELSIRTRQPAYSIQRATLASGLFKTLERMVMPCYTDDPDNAARFLVWVQPLQDTSTGSEASIYTPFDPEETPATDAEEPETIDELYLLSQPDCRSFDPLP